MTITPDINLGNIMVTGAIGAIGWGIRRLYTLIADAVERQEMALEDIDEHAEVINLHTSLFIDNGLVKGPIGLPRVEERRKKNRIFEAHS